MTAGKHADEQPHEVTSIDFACVSPHPYGVLPKGNVYLDDNGIGPTKKVVVQPLLSILPEDVWQQVLSYCDGRSLGRVVQTCREWYVAGHQPELWRDLVLQQHNNQRTGTNSKQGHQLDHVSDTWRDTYVLQYQLRQRQSVDDKKKEPFCPHVPMAVPGVYSDVYYRTHLCRCFALPPSWFTTTPSSSCGAADSKNQVPRVQNNLSVDDFYLQYEQPNRPVVLAGAAKSWDAVRKWTNVEYLTHCTTGKAFRATSGAAPYSTNFTMESYHQYCQSKHLEEAPLYLFDRTALLNNNNNDGKNPLKDDYLPDLKRTCPMFDPDASATNRGHDLFQFLGDGKRPDHTWLIMGPKRSGSSFHLDPNATHAWNAAIVGRKRWIFYPPGVTPPGIHPSPDGDEVAMPISIGEWIHQYWSKHVERKRRAPPAEQPLECTVEPGDVMFVPHGWWHAVINLDDDMNIAITHNYVSCSNLSNVLRFLQTKQDQISGCRDRQQDAIQPENLYRAFTSALQQVHPVWLQEAQVAQQKQGWTCRAWMDETSTTTSSNDNNKHKPRKQPKRRRLTGGDEEEELHHNSNVNKNSIMARAKTDEPDAAAGGGFSFSFL